MSTQKARQRILDIFGFDFPDDFYDCYEFLQQHQDLKILEELQMDPSSVFDVFEEDFETLKLGDFLHQSRYYDDPPEFITLFFGNTDGLHWGYFFDDPGSLKPYVVSYYHSDAYEFSVHGQDLLGALREQLEQLVESHTQEMKYDHDFVEDYKKSIEKLAEIRSLLKPYTQNRPEESEAYLEKYPAFQQRASVVVAPTFNQMGILAPPETYQSPGAMEYHPEEGKIIALIEEARIALEAKLAATALQIGQNFWTGQKKFRPQIYELLEQAYLQLGRPLLNQLLQAAIQSRNTFDQGSEARKQALNKRINQFKVGMIVDFRGKKGKIQSIEGEAPTSVAIIQFEDDDQARPYQLDSYAFFFKISEE